MPTELTIELRRVDAVPAAVTEVVTDRAHVGDQLSQALSQVAAYLARNATRPAGPAFAVYRFTDEGGWHVTAGFPVDGPITPGDGVHTDVQPGGEVAVATHAGSYESVRATWSALEEWVRLHELHPAGAPWERYLVGPGDTPDPARWRTEICWPVG